MQGGKRVDHRRVGAGDAVGEGHEAAALLLGQLHQPDDLGEQGVVAGRAHGDLERRLEVDGAGEDAGARADRRRHGLAGDRLVSISLRPLLTLPSTPIRSPVATSTVCPASSSSGRQRCGCGRRAASRVTALARERHQPLDGRARHAAGAAVEVAADQQEEQQHDGAVEIGMLAAADRLEQATSRGPG